MKTQHLTRRLFVVFTLALSFVCVIQGSTLASPPHDPHPQDKDGKKKLSRYTVTSAARLSNDALDIYIAEQNSDVWYYQYAPGQWGESNYHEHFAIYTPALGAIESESFQVVQPFTSQNGGSGTITGILRSNGVEVQRRIVMLPGSVRYFKMEYKITNVSNATINDLRFFEAIDFDIPYTGYHTNDYGWYDPVTNYVGVRDDQFFRNIVTSVPASDRHGVAYWFEQIYNDWDDGQLNGNNSYGPNDAAVAKQFNLGSLAPQQHKEVSFNIWFDDPPNVSTCIYGQVADTNGIPLVGALVKLNGEANNSSIYLERLTDSQGNFRFDNLSPGNYLLQASLNDNSDPSSITGFSLGQGCLYISPRLSLPFPPILLTKAQEYAPIIYQDTDNSKYEADFITAFNYDGSWDGTTKWENISSYPLFAYVYWNGAESDTHYFLRYYLYHPRDWGEYIPETEITIECIDDTWDSGLLDKVCHENDLEGVIYAINKSNGKVEGVVAIWHNIEAFWDICLPPETIPYTPRVYSEAKTHALHCGEILYPFPGNDGVIYQYGGIAEEPSDGNARGVKYNLIHTNQLASKLGSPDAANMFAEGGTRFKGIDFGDDAASTPWDLDVKLCDHLNSCKQATTSPTAILRSVNNLYAGSLYADPARLFATLFPTHTYSTNYVYNPYLTSVAQFQPDAGSTASTPLGEATVYLPYRAITESAMITLTYNVPSNLDVTASDLGVQFYLVDRPFSFEVRKINGTAPSSFNAPLNIEIKFSPAVLRENQLDINKLKIMRWQNGSWYPLATAVDVQNSKAKAFTDSLGVFGLFAPREYKVYLPLVSKSQPANTQGLYGRVTQNGANAAGVPLSLRFYNGSSWSTLATTTTAADGTYSFTGVPSLGSGQGYYVRYQNTAGTVGRLWLWNTRVLTSYTAGSNIAIGNFDIADIVLVSPAPGATVALPYTFQWTRRTATPSDSYELDLYDYYDGDPYAYTGPLGYVGSFTINGLPTGFSPWVPYVWTIWAYSPDGGVGLAYWSNYVTFSNTGFRVATDSLQNHKRNVEDLPVGRPSPRGAQR